jgi:hypothetical protein
MKQYPENILIDSRCDLSQQLRLSVAPAAYGFHRRFRFRKSVIADLLQLIFVAKKEFWESGTDVMTTEKRTVEGVVLKQGGDAGQGYYGYAFANVEVEHDKFIIVGTHIQTNARSVYPFIIQKGHDFNPEAELNLEAMDQFLLYRDFLPNNQTAD